MSAEPFLAFDGVWKRFRRGQVHDSLRDLIPALVRKITGKERVGDDERDFWALRDISFEVRPGHVLGIIGANGAGKSTALKVLNQLMDPTKGRVRSRGKIGSLIEVSAGFHQDLTGRQNVFLQGAIMGMKRSEILRKFDQIVDFSGISEFMDTPVKRYSSGMNARLGFSIAAHLEPDILIIDEVLAVGDHSFQQRAFAKIKSIAKSGAPVVLVSHQLDRIAELCTECLLLRKGEVQVFGSPGHCISAYLHPPESEQTMQASSEAGVHFHKIEVLTGTAIFSGENLSMLISGACTRPSYPRSWQLAFHIANVETGQGMHSVLSPQRGIPMPTSSAFEHRIDLQMNLAPGNYFLELFVFDMERNEPVFVGPRVSIEVLERNKYWGAAQLNSSWTVVASEPISDPDATGGSEGARNVQQHSARVAESVPV